ncbi:unnamed protein product [Nezara viridula]|uniref:Nuclear pore membrane glycoprotein 210 n=1 Tax=Nezara viridula TaxID=85310 RepID=A0A9P0E2C4_NEZVI|nr:unnamed protein product [Nezara viridula]
MALIKRNYFILCLICCYIQLNYGDDLAGSKLSVPRVLLPLFRDLSINFTLDISGGGCYKWSSSRRDIVEVVPLYGYAEECSRQATITVVTKELTRNTAIILAKDVFTGQILRADVIVDKIDSLQIVTTTRELFIEEPPEMFEVRAYDDQGNEFTTLVGVEFQWTVHTVAHASTGPVMKLMTFSDSPYETPLPVANFDRLGKHGHMALLEGIRTGSAKVSVKLPHSEYKQVPAVDVQLIVVANLILKPAVAFILPGDVIEYQLYQIRQGKMININFMGAQYSLLSENEDIAVVSERKAFAKVAGQVKIILRDNNVPESDKIIYPSATLNVALPSYMTLSLLPFQSWSLTINQNATIVPQLFTSNGQKFYIGENAEIRTSVPKENFHVQNVIRNGSVIGKTIRIGSGHVTSALYGVNDPNINQPLKLQTSATLEVFPDLGITPGLYVAPWIDSDFPALSSHKLTAFGGDGDYEWNSENKAVVEVNQDGLLKFNGLGQTLVNVCMRKNKLIKASSRIYVLEPHSLSVFSEYSEVPVGGEVVLHISLFGKVTIGSTTRLKAFDYCQHLEFIVSPQDPFYKIEKAVNNSLGCAARVVKSRSVGEAEVVVKLRLPTVTLEGSLRIRSHPPLVSIQPISKQVLLALGSSYHVVFSGGPSPSFGPYSTHLTITNDKISASKVHERPGLYVYSVTCLQIGSSDVNIFVKTMPLIKYSKSVESVYRVKVFCKLPKSLNVIRNYNTGCPDVIQDKIIAYPSSKTKFSIKIMDDLGNSFDNATSLLYDWNFLNQTMATFQEPNKVYLDEVEYDFYKRPLTHYIVVITNNNTGEVLGKGMAFNYRKEALTQYNLNREDWSIHGKVVTHFALSVASEPFIETSFMSIFNHPLNMVNLLITGGSGHFQFEVKPRSIVDVRYVHQKKMAEIHPLNEGTCEITIADRCLPPFFNMSIDVKVINVAYLQIETASKIQEGQQKKVTVKVFDKEEYPLAFPVFSVEKMGMVMECSDTSIADFDKTEKVSMDSNKGIINFILKAKKIGEVTIWARWFNITSNVLNIQVFPRVKINPRNLTLVVGSEIQIDIIGGPSIDSALQYMTADSFISTVSPDAVVKGLRPGRTSLTAIAVGHQGEVYSKDTVEVNVVTLAGVYIVAPITNLGVGNMMPMWACGLPHTISPLLLGSISPPLQFKWSTSVPNIVMIKDVFYNTNIQIGNENKLSVRILGLKPGQTSIELSVTGRGFDKNIFTFNSSFRVDVVSRLEWMRPNIGFPFMLMAPNTNYQLKTNLVEKEVKYRISTMRILPETVLGDNNVVQISSEGILTSGSNFGTAVISARSSEFISGSDEIHLMVKIRPVHYLMINVDTPLETSEDVKSLPRGLYLNINITYHDKYGSVFFVAPFSKPVHSCSVCSKVHIEYLESNHSLVTSLTSIGSVILKFKDVMYGRQIEMEDYVKIPVDNYISPNRNFMTVGEIICFSTPLITDKGVWSADNNPISISKYGVAKAVRPGPAVITFSLSYPEPRILSSTVVEVLPLQSFLFGSMSRKMITNSINVVYLVPVFLINEKQKKHEYYSKNCRNQHVDIDIYPFSCELHYTSSSKLYPVENIFSVKADFNITMGSYACVITPIKGAAKDISKIESNITLTVTNQKSLYETLLIYFYPQFNLDNNRVTITKRLRTVFIEVSGIPAVLKDLFAIASDPEVISVGDPFLSDDNVLSIPIIPQVFAAGVPEIYITVSSKLTSQEERVQVVFTDTAEPESFLRSLINVIYHIVMAIFEGLIFYHPINSFMVYSLILCIVVYYFASFLMLKNDYAETPSRPAHLMSPKSFRRVTTTSRFNRPRPMPGSAPSVFLTDSHLLHQESNHSF